jgi:hypothetical protein
MLRLSKEGHIFTVSELDGKSVLLENEDLYNNVFQSFEIEEDFSFISFFEMVKQYPLFLKFFQQGSSYLEEYELIDKSVGKDTNKIAVITPQFMFKAEVMSQFNKMEIYSYNESESYCDDDISSMYLKDYINYRLGINSLALVDSVDENGVSESVYFEYFPETQFSLMDFVHFVFNTISLHGFVEERNTVIEEIERDEKEMKEHLESEANDLTAKFFEQIKSGGNS